VKRFLGVFLGILTAIGGFVDMGDLVANASTGARFEMNLAWVVVVGVIGIIVYAEMAGRVASVTKRATFDLVRERLSQTGQSQALERSVSDILEAAWETRASARRRQFRSSHKRRIADAIRAKKLPR